MDTKTEITNQPQVQLPGIGVTVMVPAMPNFLREAYGAGTFPVSRITADDATLLGLAMARRLIEHWRNKTAEQAKLSPSEDAMLDAPRLLPMGIVTKAAEAAARDDGVELHRVAMTDRAKYLAHAFVTIAAFLKEITK